MESQITLAMTIGLATLALGLLAAIVSLALLLANPGKQRALRHLLVAIGLGFAGFIIGAGLGMQYFCSPSDAGNLCGLGGALGTGPFAAGVGLIAGSILMLKAR